jgi:hypothetical protein
VEREVCAVRRSMSRAARGQGRQPRPQGPFLVFARKRHSQRVALCRTLSSGVVTALDEVLDAASESPMGPETAPTSRQRVPNETEKRCDLRCWWRAGGIRTPDLLIRSRRRRVRMGSVWCVGADGRPLRYWLIHCDPPDWVPNWVPVGTTRLRDSDLLDGRTERYKQGRTVDPDSF